MTTEERSNAVNWMLDQIEAVEKRNRALRFGETKVEVCDNGNSVHCYGEGFPLLAEAINADLKREPFIERTDKLSFSFINVEFYRLVPAESEADDEKQTE